MTEAQSPSNRNARTIRGFTVRQTDQDDAATIAAIARSVSAEPAAGLFDAVASPGAVERMLQTGHRFLVAEHHGSVCGFVRTWTDEGIGWFDLLAATTVGAGRALLHAVEMQAQEGGLRLLRCRVPEGILEDYFGWLGYLPISREEDGQVTLVLERRLPLLTVRGQRREDAAFIAGMTGRDSYVFEMGARPGWFIAADGDRPVGVAWVADGGGGGAEVPPPVLLDNYRHRGLEAWMLERAAYHAQHAGYHSARLAADQWLKQVQRDLEDRGWFPDGDGFIRRFASSPGAEHDEGEAEDW